MYIWIRTVSDVHAHTHTRTHAPAHLKQPAVAESVCESGAHAQTIALLVHCKCRPMCLSGLCACVNEIRVIRCPLPVRICVRMWGVMMSFRVWQYVICLSSNKLHFLFFINTGEKKFDPQRKSSHGCLWDKNLELICTTGMYIRIKAVGKYGLDFSSHKWEKKTWLKGMEQLFDAQGSVLIRETWILYFSWPV